VSRLLRGDCLIKMDKIKDHSIDMILVDPPYGVTACKWDSIINLESMWKQINRIVKNNGAIVITSSQPFTTVLINSNMKMFKYCWVWEKNTGTNFFHASRQPIRYAEDILVFMNGSCYYNPQKTTGHVPTNSGIGRNTGNIYSGKSKVDYKGGDTTRYPKNIIKFNTVNNYDRVHPTQKPVALMEYLIKTYTNENDKVLDFCMGSGTTGVACKNLNRKFVGIEKDKGYFEIAKQRIRRM